MNLDFDKWISKVKAGEFLAEDELKALCDYVKEVRCASDALPSIYFQR